MNRRLDGHVLAVFAPLVAAGCIIQASGVPTAYRYQWAQDDHCWRQTWFLVRQRGDDLHQTSPTSEQQARLDYESCVRSLGHATSKTSVRYAVQPYAMQPNAERPNAVQPSVADDRVVRPPSTATGTERAPAPSGAVQLRPGSLLSAIPRQRMESPAGFSQSRWRPSPGWRLDPSTDPKPAPRTDGAAEGRQRRQSAFQAERDGSLLVVSIMANMSGCLSVSANQQKWVVDEQCVVDVQASSCPEVKEFSQAHGVRALTALASSTTVRKIRAPFNRFVARTLTKCR